MMKDPLKRIMNAVFNYQKPLSSKEGENVKEPLEAEGTYFSGCVISDIGCVRSANEDNYVMCKHMNTDLKEHSEAFVSFPQTPGEWRFAGVFDGMGGGEMGELAAHDTADIFLKAFCGIGKGLSKAGVDSIMQKAFLEANNRIIDLQKNTGCLVLREPLWCQMAFILRFIIWETAGHISFKRMIYFRSQRIKHLLE